MIATHSMLNLLLLFYHIYYLDFVCQILFVISLFKKGKKIFGFTGHLCEEECRMLFHQLLDAVSYLHALDVVHRDIKCDNIMLDEHYNIKLGGNIDKLVSCSDSRMGDILEAHYFTG